MKKVFRNSSEVIHVYVTQTQSEGKCSNVFFYGNKLYSYGYHYQLAEITENKKGEKYILINNSGYSSTTSGHISEITYASKQFKQLFELSTNSKKVLSHLENYLLPKLLKAKKPEIYISEANRLFNTYSENCIFLGIKPEKEIVNIYKCFSGANYQEILEKRKKELRVKELKEKKQRELKLKTDITKFLNYEIDYIYNSQFEYVRLSKDKETIETSLRAYVPIKESELLYKRIQAGKDIKGFKIGNYTVIGINGVLTIGCHKIERNEVERFARLMNW